MVGDGPTGSPAAAPRSWAGHASPASTLDDDGFSMPSVSRLAQAMCCLFKWQNIAMLASMSTSLDVDVRAGLEAKRGDWRSIATASGVSYSWLSKFVNRRIQNPGFATLKAIHGVLTSPPAAPSLSAPAAAAAGTTAQEGGQ